MTNVLPNWFAAINKRLGENVTQNHIVGDSFTIADFGFAAAFNSIFLNEANDHYATLKPILESYENVRKYATALNGELSAYLAARPQPRPF